MRRLASLSGLVVRLTRSSPGWFLRVLAGRRLRKALISLLPLIAVLLIAISPLAIKRALHPAGLRKQSSTQPTRQVSGDSASNREVETAAREGPGGAPANTPAGDGYAGAGTSVAFQNSASGESSSVGGVTIAFQNLTTGEGGSAGSGVTVAFQNSASGANDALSPGVSVAFEAGPTPAPRRRPVIFIPGILGSRLDNFPPLFYNQNPLWPSLPHFLPDGGIRADNLWYLLDRGTQTAGVNIKATNVIRRLPPNLPIVGNTDVYESFLATLAINGYTEYKLGGDPNRLTGAGCDFDGQRADNPNLFVFPYDWRLSNAENASRLKDYVKCVQRFNPAPDQKIDIVTHSMGGLLARSYLVEHPSEHHVGKLITIAAPWLGAPKATRALVAGDFWDSLVGRILTSASFRSLGRSFPSVHELMPSRSYFELVGAPPPYILNGRVLSYDEMTSLLDSRFSASQPGSRNRSFHQTTQDDWNDPSNPINTSVEYHHLYGVKVGVAGAPVADTVGVVSERQRISCPPIIGCFTLGTVYDVGLTAGDGTVPTLSALRTEGPNGLNAPDVSRASGRIKDFRCFGICEHTKLMQNPAVKSRVLEILQAPAPAAPDETARPLPPSTASGAESETQPAYLLTVIGAASALIQESGGGSTNPLADPPDEQVPGATSYIIGEKSFTSVMPVGQTYTINLRSATNPMIVELKEGNEAVTTRAVRYNDFSVPPGVNLRLRITPQGIDALRYDSDGDGTFESVVEPKASVTGAGAQDTEPPAVSISETRHQTGVSVVLTANDSGSGVKTLHYSLDGATYQPYANPFTVDPYLTPVVYAFADDHVANRSGLITFSLTAPPSTLQFSSSSYSAGEGDARATIAVTRSGDASGVATVGYFTVDDPAAVRCDVANGTAYARCDYATTVDTLRFEPGQTEKVFTVPILDDAHAEGPETVTLRLGGVSGAAPGAPGAVTLTILDNDAAAGPNPISGNQFFVRQQYLDFLSREPEAGEPWTGVLGRCLNVFNTDPNSPSAGCDRILVSQSFFQSPEFSLKGFYAYLFYRVAFNRRPAYEEIILDMRSLAGATPQEVFSRRAQYADSITQRPEFAQLYGQMSNQQYVNALLGSYGAQQITTEDTQNFEGTAQVTRNAEQLVNALNANALSRAQVLRAVVQSSEVDAAEYHGAFVSMQYYGYLRRSPEQSGYDAWVRVIRQDPNNIREMVNGFVNSQEYRLRFGAP